VVADGSENAALIPSSFGGRVRLSKRKRSGKSALIPSPFGGRVRERGAARSAAFGVFAYSTLLLIAVR
jgi:hypothetical protein